MAFVLIIDTALEKGGVGLFKENNCMGIEENTLQNAHASFVQPAIDRLINNSGCQLDDLDAIAVVNGPGSYTGLRVGLATAKGIAYALGKKLIAIDTLDSLAFASRKANHNKDFFYIPMIDARRADVFCSIYDASGIMVAPQAVWTLIPEICSNYCKEKMTVINGSGAAKAAQILSSESLQFSDVSYSLSDVNELAQDKYGKNDFVDVAYCEPHYLKAFYTTAKPLKD